VPGDSQRADAAPPILGNISQFFFPAGAIFHLNGQHLIAERKAGGSKNFVIRALT